MSPIPPMALVVLVWLAGLGAAAQFGKISVLFDILRNTYGGHGEAALGLVVSVLGMMGLIFGTTAGMLVARIGPRRALVAALLLGAAVSVIEASLPPYPVMILLRVLEGISHLAIVVVGPTMIANLAPARQRAFAMTLWATFFAVTYAILALIAPWLMSLGGAAALFLSHAAYMALLAILLGLALPCDPPRPDRASGSLLKRHAAIYASPRVAAPAMGFCFYTFLYVAMLTLLPPAAAPGWNKVLATGFPAASILVSLSFGIWILGRRPAVRLVQFGYLSAIPGFVLLGLFWGQGLGMAVGALWVAGAMGIVQGASFASIPELNGSTLARAEASGAVAQLGNLGTTSGTPVLAALLAGSGPWSMAGLAVLCCISGFLIHEWQARRRQTRAD